jgi:hypothetical protein
MSGTAERVKLPNSRTHFTCAHKPKDQTWPVARNELPGVLTLNKIRINDA